MEMKPDTPATGPSLFLLSVYFSGNQVSYGGAGLKNLL